MRLGLDGQKQRIYEYPWNAIILQVEDIYLRGIMKQRNEVRPIVFVDET
jgi:hypothetical protein